MIRLSLEILRASWLNFLPNFVIHTGGRKKEHVLMGPPATWTIRWLRIPLKKALISWARWHFFIICSICFPMYRHYDMVLPFVLPTCTLTHHCVPCLCTTWQNLQIKIVCFFSGILQGLPILPRVSRLVWHGRNRHAMLSDVPVMEQKVVLQYHGVATWLKLKPRLVEVETTFGWSWNHVWLIDPEEMLNWLCLW